MYLLFDIGGTHTRLAISEDGIDYSDSRIYQTPQDYNLGLKLLKDTAYILTGGKPIKAVGGGVAGPLSKDKSYLIKFTNSPGWSNQALKTDLEGLFNVPVHLENDAALVGLGEATHGAGVGYKIVAYITASTGVGGTRIVDEKLDLNSMGFEPGHQIVNALGNEPCNCGGVGHLESYISGVAIQRKYNKEAKDIDDPEVWDELSKWLAVGLNNVIVHWSPDVVVLGGGLVRKLPMEKIRSYLNMKLKIFPHPPDLVLAKLSEFGGIYGALEYLKQQLHSPVIHPSASLENSNKTSEQG
jgi:predicted NBD/HSP70 family sugar kinase